MFIDTDANLVEINPLILTKKNKIVCLDAKMTFDENALFKHPEIQKLRDFNEEEETEIEVEIQAEGEQVEEEGEVDETEKNKGG